MLTWNRDVERSHLSVKVILFDFDGTIADSLEAIVGITNRLAKEFGYQQTSRGELAQLKNLSSRQIVKKSGVAVFKLPFLMRKVTAELNKEIPSLSTILGMQEALIELKNRGYTLGIITSNSPENVRAFLETKELKNLFNFIYSGTTLFGKGRVIKKLLKQESILPEEVIYVGDETRDIEAARKSQVKAIAVSWGFNSPEVLALQNPDFLIHHPYELINVVSN